GYSLSMLLFGTAGWLALNGFIEGTYVILACLLASRSVFGLVGSGASPAAQAYVADRTTPEERTNEIASVTSGFSVGTVAGPAFAAAMVAVFGLLSPVFFTFVAAGIMSFLLFTRLPENTPPRTDAALPRPEIPGAKGLWRDPRVLPFLVYAVGLSIITGVLTQTFVFAVIDKMGVSGTEAAQFTGPAFSIGAMATLLSQLVIIPRFRMGTRTLMTVGAISLCTGALLIVPTDNFAVLIVAQFAIGLGQGLARPGFSSGASLAVGPELQGNVAGLVIACNGMGFVVSPFLGPLVYEFVHPAAPFLIAAVLLTGLALFARFVLPAQPGEAPKAEIPG
ncbi:MAG: MFS transporter, partial [Pseudomonadota bacterium]